MNEQMVKLFGACNLLSKEGGIILSEGKPPVMPRFWFMGEAHSMDVYHYKVTLDNTDKDYIFAFDVTALEVFNDVELPQKRMVEAAKILMADYHRQNP